MTKRDGRSSGTSRGRAARLLALLLAAVCLAPIVAQEEEDLSGSFEKYRNILALAVQKLDDLDLSEALAGFTEVIDAYKTGQLSATTPLVRQLVGQAYEGRARTNANLGRGAEAEADYEALIRFDISWPIDRERVSPKITALYDGVRERLVGALSVQTEPAGAQILIDGETVGPSPLFGRQMLAGTYSLRVQREGFETVTEPIVVQGGGQVERVLRLTPDARDILMTTSPSGARVSVDGQERGSTFGQAGPDYEEVAAAMGLTPADVSAPLLIEHLAPGRHLVRIELECHEPQLLGIEVALDKDRNLPLRFEPIRLTPSLGSLSVESIPAGAEVLVDGEPAGTTPARVEEVCSGEHDVALRSEAGQWIGRVDVEKGRRVTVSERLRRTLAYAGMPETGPGGQPPAGEEELARLLLGLEEFTVLAPGAGLPDTLLAREAGMEGLHIPDEYASRVQRVAGANLILVARLSEGGFGRRLELVIRSADYGIEDRLEISLDDKAQVEELRSRLEARTKLTSPWLGISVIETHGSANPIVIRVRPASPAAEAGVQLGDAVVSLAGAPIASGRDLNTALSGLKEGSQSSLTLQRAGAPPFTLNVRVGSTPVMLPPEDPGRIRSSQAAELTYRAKMEQALGRPESDERSNALMGLATLLMQSGMYRPALEVLEQVRLPAGPGISEGTIAYLRGVCLDHLDRPEEASRLFQQASTCPDATLQSHDGPPVAERALRTLERMGEHLSMK